MDSPNNGAPEPTGRRPRGRPRAFDEKTEQNTIKALDRAMDILRALSRMDGATLTALAQETGDVPATVYRVLVTLQAHGIVEADEAAQTWHVGPGAFLIGSAFLRRTSLVERSRPALRRLMEQSGETANLGIASDDRVLFVSQVETHAPIRAFFPPGTRSAMHASGIGKVLMAAMDAPRLERIVAAGLTRYTPRTLTEPNALLADLEAIRKRGYAIDDEERNLGMRCIAAPIRNAHQEVIAGLSVSGPISRMTPDKTEALAVRVMTAAASVSAGMGARD
ncbi:transcriptional regulator, IclR family [Oceaniovalibus guishaninsula JLT2003]|uniref:Transcriptional regulator, IclR family n=1 Tax=Oceaniovalibus guishaninsula JLT2003 TaxID=1231392 RepID=K2HJW4_9RHOB|nr:HTH-type transcriptional regulator BhcR [Oceaniovalibus guishaninsula]EKE43289.1 transcriptional regulator, IclR family [Oceaniovalibus guishaninsula JLT2003]